MTYAILDSNKKVVDFTSVATPVKADNFVHIDSIDGALMGKFYDGAGFVDSIVDAPEVSSVIPLDAPEVPAPAPVVIDAAKVETDAIYTAIVLLTQKIADIATAISNLDALTRADNKTIYAGIDEVYKSVEKIDGYFIAVPPAPASDPAPETAPIVDSTPAIGE